MAVEVALEDDLFFADLNRQISLLIDEDEEDYPAVHFSSISPQVLFTPAYTSPFCSCFIISGVIYIFCYFSYKLQRCESVSFLY